MASASAPDTVCYELRSSKLYLVAAWGLSALALTGLVLLLGWAPHARMGGVFWLLLVGILATPIAMWSSVSTYVVPGGRAQLQVNSDGLRLESSARIQLFPLSDLRIHITEHRAQFRIFAVPAGTVQTDVHLRLSAGSEGLILSRRLFEDPDRMDALLADLERLRAGEPPLGVSHAREAAERASVDPETAKLEARLDAEIDAADS